MQRRKLKRNRGVYKCHTFGTLQNAFLYLYPIFRINIPQRNTFRTPVPSTLKSILARLSNASFLDE